jgi:hypothetical protein
MKMDCIFLLTFPKNRAHLNANIGCLDPFAQFVPRGLIAPAGAPGPSHPRSEWLLLGWSSKKNHSANSIQTKRGCMKRKVLSKILATSLLVAFAVACAFAGGNTAVLKAKIPFGFSVGEVSLPAGEYTVFGREGTSFLLIQDDQTNQGCAVLSNPGKSFVPDGKGKLQFHRYGDQYFLSQVFAGFEHAGHKLPVSKQEKEQMVATSNNVAQNSASVDVVIYGTR